MNWRILIKSKNLICNNRVAPNSNSGFRYAKTCLGLYWSFHFEAEMLVYHWALKPKNFHSLRFCLFQWPNKRKYEKRKNVLRGWIFTFPNCCFCCSIGFCRRWMAVNLWWWSWHHFFRQVSVLSLPLPNTVSLLLESVLHCCVPDVYCLRCTQSDFELRTVGKVQSTLKSFQE